MTESMNFKIEGLEEMERDLTAAVRAAPEKVEKILAKNKRKLYNNAIYRGACKAG